MRCDPETGACLLPDLDAASENTDTIRSVISYVGDPMCSWCWGMSPVVTQLAEWCATRGQPFRMVMGGLRAGGGDPWNSAFRGFLRQEWTHIADRTGQPFGFGLLERSHFSYDTEPACRAVVTARHFLADDVFKRQEQAFFAAVQKKFYVEGEDPKQPEFYRNICAEAGLDFASFALHFDSAEARQAVMSDFRLARQLGVRAFPSIVLEKEGKTHQVAAGYVGFAALQDRLQTILTA